MRFSRSYWFGIVFALLLVAFIGLTSTSFAHWQYPKGNVFIPDGTDAVIYGQVLHGEVHWTRGQIVTDYTVRLDLALGLEQTQVTVRVPGGVLGDIAMGATSVPHLRPGERVLLFLDRLPAGEWRVWGGPRGHYEVINGWAIRESNGQTFPLVELWAQLEQVWPGEQVTRGLPPRDVLPRPARVPPRTTRPENFVYSGLRWPDPNPMNEVYLINPANGKVASDAFVQAVRNAAANWTNVSCSYFRFPYGGLTTVSAAASDGVNVVLWGPLEAGVLGRATYWYWPSSGEIVEADTVINTNYTWATGSTIPPDAFDVESVVLHEFGHWLSLDHDDDPNAVMYASIPPGVIQRKLYTTDIAGICYIYPANTPTPTPTTTAPPPATPTPTPTSRFTPTPTPTFTPTPTPTATPTPCPVPICTPTPTPTPTPTATPTPTPTPSNTWMRWRGGGGLSGVLAPQGSPLTFVYGNVRTPAQFEASVAGDARFADGSTRVQTRLLRASGQCSLTLVPTTAENVGTPYTVTVRVGDMTLTQSGVLGGWSTHIPFFGNPSGPVAPPPLDACTAHVVGYVFYDEDADGHFDTGETGYTRVEVVLWSRGKRVASTMPDENGAFRFSDLAEGPYALTIVGPSTLIITTPDAYYLTVQGADVYGPFNFGVIP